jgi:muconate cycloisomerase
MRIARIETTPLILRSTTPYHWAGRVDYGAYVVLVEVHTDDGIVGIGESTAGFPPQATAQVLQGVAERLVGESVHDIERLVTGVRHLGSFNHAPRAANLTLAGLEMALWDAVGKAAGVPVYDLLGGAVRDEVDYFGFPQGDTADELARDAHRLAGEGYGVIYTKAGFGADTDMENIAAVREAIGDRRLRIDANGAWSVEEAIRMIHRLQEFDLDWVEQPTPETSLAALKHVRDSVPVPIAADQSVYTVDDVYEVCGRRAADVIVLSPHETGGILAFRRAAGIAMAAGVSICLHGQGVSSITDAAQHHLGLCTAGLTDGNQIMHQLFVEDLAAAPALDPVGGRIGRVEGPGFGVTVDREAVARAAELAEHPELLTVIESVAPRDEPHGDGG